MTRSPHRHPVGPPWIGPVRTRTKYERRYLYVLLAMLAAAMMFFGFRALSMVIVIAGSSMAVYAMYGLVQRVLRKTWPRSASPLLALNMSLMLALTMPMLHSMNLSLVAGIIMGIAVHLMGPAHRVRIHPVAFVHCLLLVTGLMVEPPAVSTVLSPTNVVFGDVYKVGKRHGGPLWWDMAVAMPNDAMPRDNPHRVMLQEQKHILENDLHLVSLMRGSELPRAEDPITNELPRVFDLLLGAVPGPVGATSKLLIILAGLYLIHQRVSRWPMVLISLAAALAMMCILPMGTGANRMSAGVYFLHVGPAVSVGYIAYQLLGTPLLFLLLIMLPMTPPRTVRGRVVYAILLGGGIVAMRWYATVEDAEYVPFLFVGSLMAMLDQLRRSAFVPSTGRALTPAAGSVSPTVEHE